MSGAVSLKELLVQHTMESAPELVVKGEDEAVRCLACGHRCRILPGRSGVCRVRFNDGGRLMAPSGYVSSLQIDPIEKKPFYHAYPARDAMSFGMLGCDFHCSYCQNWITSQTLRDDRAVVGLKSASAEELVALAVEHGAPLVVSTYNEPLITADWAVEIFKLARRRDLVCGMVSNGNGTPEVLEFIRPYVDLFKIDLKGFDDRRYRSLGGVLQTVLDTIRLTVEMGFWVEVVTLVVPGFNDSDEELRQIADFLAGVSVDIPWHVTAFHPDYKMADRGRTPAATLARTRGLGKSAGLKFVYVGNIAGQGDGSEHTWCPECGELLIRRSGFFIEENRMQGDKCPKCSCSIPGVWEASPPRSTNGIGLPRPTSLGKKRRR
ncbi:MAG TPA: AmmeMemoRadiSam system radical SAM enzyme [Phycisphaerae bacterium]|nr:AmmeMemoRadiSam system radical SAM enzyme [Phycisphaerae bacterium]